MKRMVRAETGANELPGKLRLSQPSIALFVGPLTLWSSKGAVSRVPPGRIQREPLHPRDAEQCNVQKHSQPMSYLGPANADRVQASASCTSCILHEAAAVQGYIGVIRTGVQPPQSLLYPNKNMAIPQEWPMYCHDKAPKTRAQRGSRNKFVMGLPATGPTGAGFKIHDVNEKSRTEGIQYDERRSL